MYEPERSGHREPNLTELRERAAHGDSDAVAQLLDIGDERTDAVDLSEYDLGLDAEPDGEADE
ncbi:hypothetical protein [Nocardia grenadensis]|uniref:hypothetical protein n=1 Tax=Nocardia grenadensis TaxID=931537 RepID=UPI0007A3F1D5|nr:hypothetical protein [Nocardia grenadensis]